MQRSSQRNTIFLVEDTSELLQDMRMFRRKKQEQQRLAQQQKEDLYEKVKQQHLDSSNVTTEQRNHIINKIKHQVKYLSCVIRIRENLEISEMSRIYH